MTTSVLPRDYAARSRFYPHVLAGNPPFLPGGRVPHPARELTFCVGTFTGEIPIDGVPVVEVLHPGDCFIGSGDFAQVSPNFKQCLPCRGAWVEGEVGAHVQPHVEDAALREGVRPLFPKCCAYP